MTEIERLLLNALEQSDREHQRVSKALQDELVSLTEQVMHLSHQLASEAKKTDDLMQQLREFQTVFSRLTSQ